MKNSFLLGLVPVTIIFLLLYLSFPEQVVAITIGWITATVTILLAYSNSDQTSITQNPRMLVGEPPDYWSIGKYPWSKKKMGQKVRSWLLAGPMPRYHPRRYEPRYGSGYFYRTVKFATHAAEYKAPND